MSTPMARSAFRDRWRVLRVCACMGILATVLESCMTLGDAVAPPPEPVPPPPAVALDVLPPEPPAPKPEPKPLPKKASRQPRAEPAVHAERRTIDPKTLIGLSQAGVRGLLGDPKLVRTDHLSLTWVYQAPGCSMHVVFYPSLEDASFHVLKLGGSNNDGNSRGVSDACVNRILVARSNAH